MAKREEQNHEFHVTGLTEDRKLFKEENFYQFLAPFVENGSSITGWGEEVGDYWRVVFDGIGKYTLQKPVFIDGKTRRMMDAAPELLDACERLLVYKSIHPEHFESVNTVIMDAMRKAVEKANGHPQEKILKKNQLTNS